MDPESVICESCLSEYILLPVDCTAWGDTEFRVSHDIAGDGGVTDLDRHVYLS